MIVNSKKAVTLVVLVLVVSTSYAQRKVSGYVYDATDSTAIDFVDVYTPSGATWMVTDKQGYFEITDLSSKLDILVFSRMGFMQQVVELDPQQGELTIYLSKENYRVEGITVTGSRVQQQKLGSVIRFNRASIEAVQSNSLGDILKLLPGQTLTNPNTTQISQANLRLNNNVGGQYSRANSFGTSIIIDGTPVSNNGGMQTLNSANASSLRANSSVNAGVDLRTIPTNTIESIEVVEGVAGVRYGDLSSGAVIITNKAGSIPLTVRSSYNANAYSLGIINGLKINDKAGFITYDLDYLRSIGDPIDPTTVYNRINLGARWSYNKQLSNNRYIRNTISTSFAANLDGIKNDPDARVSADNRSVNNRFTLNNSGKMQINKTFFKSINYTTSFSHNYQKTEFNQRKNYDGAPIINKDLTGTYFAENLSGNFTQRTIVTGNPINLYSRLEALGEIKIGAISNTITIGAEVKYDANKKGKKAFSNASVSSTDGGEFNERNLDFENLPALTQYSAYLQEYAEIPISSDFKVFLEAGVRYDHILSFNLLSPRVNASFNMFDKINIRGAWGLFYKSPSIAQLYPKDIYLDKLSKSYYHADPTKRYSIISTYKINRSAQDLQPYRGETFEIGLDLNFGKWTSTLNLYHKENKDGIYSSPRLYTYQGYQYPNNHSRDITAFNKTMLFTTLYNVDENNLYSKTKGAELMLNTPKIEALNTSFRLQSAFISSQTNYSVTRILKNDYQGHADVNFRYGEYESAIDQNTSAKSSLTGIHHISEAGLLITLTGEFFWSSVQEPKEKNQRNPKAWYDRTGKRTVITPAMLETGDFDDLIIKKRDREKREEPFHTNFHLRITKETDRGHRFSFYANNFLWNRPRVKSGLNYIELNQVIFYGIDLIFKINNK